MFETVTAQKSPFTGRRTIYTDYAEVTRENVLDIIASAMPVHARNSREIDYLYNYFCGRQPILDKIKEARPEINTKMLLNHAFEIISFKVAYRLCEPIQYVNRSEEDGNVEQINKLNEYMYLQKKAAKDERLAEWMAISGIGYRIVLPSNGGNTPFVFYNLDPRSSFVIRSKGLGEPVIAGVKYIDKADGTRVFSVYTDKSYFEITENNKKSSITVEKPHTIGYVPIIEYQENSAKIGEFELVLTILDSINQIESDRVDAITGFVQAIMKIKGLDLDKKDLDELKELGAILLPENGDIDYVTSELNQEQTQKLVDDLYKKILTITGLPVTGDGNTNDSSNNGSTILRNGWYGAETRAKGVDTLFEESEIDFLTIVCSIINRIDNDNIKVSSIKSSFTRRNYENVLQKAQVFSTLAATGMVHPELLFETSDLFPDPGMAFTKSAQYEQEQRDREMQELETAMQTDTDEQKQKVGEDVNV